jgi:aldose 1-epimerase
VIELRAGAARAVLLPEAGGAVAALEHAGRALLLPVPPGGDPNRGFHGGFFMAPWTNRLDAGRLVVAGVEHRMPVNRPEENTAIHGFLREMAWEVQDATADRAVLVCRFDRAPFKGEARIEALLAPDGFTLAMALTNQAAVATPMGFGWHPYFPRPAGTRLAAAARTVFGRDARNLAIAPRPSTGVLGGDGVLDGMDTHFAGWDGTARIDWPDGAGLVLRATGAWVSNLQVFAPRGGGALAVEPVSHAPDAPNRADAAAHGAMHEVASAATIKGSLTIHWHR